MNLFQLIPEYPLSSGGVSNFKIECDALQTKDWECLAYLAAKKLQPFNHIIGIPRGGLPLANALEKYKSSLSHLPTLLVDDVLTTGTSFIQMAESIERPVIGVVAFARATPPLWVTPVFTLI